MSRKKIINMYLLFLQLPCGHSHKYMELFTPSLSLFKPRFPVHRSWRAPPAGRGRGTWRWGTRWSPRRRSCPPSRYRPYHSPPPLQPSSSSGRPGTHSVNIFSTNNLLGEQLFHSPFFEHLYKTITLIRGRLNQFPGWWWPLIGAPNPRQWTQKGPRTIVDYRTNIYPFLCM